jgi:hypothetical protein
MIVVVDRFTADVFIRHVCRVIRNILHEIAPTLWHQWGS